MISAKLRRTPNERQVTRRTKVIQINHYQNLVEGGLCMLQGNKDCSIGEGSCSEGIDNQMAQNTFI